MCDSKPPELAQSGLAHKPSPAALRYHQHMSKPDGIALASLTAAELLARRKSLKRQLSASRDLDPIRIAVLGGSTTQEVVDLLELHLLASGFLPVFYQSEFGRFYTEAVHDSNALRDFAPDLVYIHTSVLNIQAFAPVHATHADFETSTQAEFNRFREVWTALGSTLGCSIIQNNFELPRHAMLGNLDAVSPAGHTSFVTELNRLFAQAAGADPRLHLQDVFSISARLGLDQWFDPQRWFNYKIVTTPAGSNALALSLAAIIRGMFGRSRKVLVLDLDNTLWGGVIGDDGVESIQIGRETPLAEAFSAFQQYCLDLRDRGVLLAVSSKNEESAALEGLSHPDSILRREHFASFRVNWKPKAENLVAIARELNFSLDSFVFVDDSPAERALVAEQLPEVAVPDIGSDVAAFPAIIQAGRYFEPVLLSREDIARAAFYQEDLDRSSLASRALDHAEYLDALDMTAEIELFKPLYLERITQLTNKTNQFNLTTRRYTLAEMQDVLADSTAIGIYGRLSDRFGDNGLVSVVLGHIHQGIFDIELWLMSCRVIKRDLEFAMLDELVERARAAEVRQLRGSYIPSRKNALVADHYIRLGFEKISAEPDGTTVYMLQVAGYEPRNGHIRVPRLVLAGDGL